MKTYSHSKGGMPPSGLEWDSTRPGRILQLKYIMVRELALGIIAGCAAWRRKEFAYIASSAWLPDMFKVLLGTLTLSRRPHESVGGNAQHGHNVSGTTTLRLDLRNTSYVELHVCSQLHAGSNGFCRWAACAHKPVEHCARQNWRAANAFAGALMLHQARVSSKICGVNAPVIATLGF